MKKERERETSMPGRTITSISLINEKTTNKNVVSYLPAVFFIIILRSVAIDTGVFLLGLMLLRY